MSVKSEDMRYHRLSFDDDLFTAMVYKRNYGNPMVRSLSAAKSKQIESLATPVNLWDLIPIRKAARLSTSRMSLGLSLTHLRK